MTRDEVIAIAGEVASREGWPWREPVIAKKRRVFVVAGRASWHVMSNANFRGGNVNVHLDDRTGQVINKAFAPR
jgi:hypothetical protein